MDTNLLSKLTSNSKLEEVFSMYTLCPTCKGHGEIKKEKQMTLQQELIAARIEELNLAFSNYIYSNIKGEYYYKRQNELTEQLKAGQKTEEGFVY